MYKEGCLLLANFTSVEGQYTTNRIEWKVSAGNWWECMNQDVVNYFSLLDRRESTTESQRCPSDLASDDLNRSRNRVRQGPTVGFFSFLFFLINNHLYFWKNSLFTAFFHACLKLLDNTVYLTESLSECLLYSKL